MDRADEAARDVLETLAVTWTRDRANPNIKRMDSTAVGLLACALQLGRAASALERIADRFDSDAKQFSEMVEKGKGLSA